MRKLCLFCFVAILVWGLYKVQTNPSFGSDYREMAREAAEQAGFPPNVFVRQIQVESGFNPNAMGARGEVGLCQFLPETARERGIDPMDPQACLQAAATWEAQVYHQTGSVAAALAAYNCGNGCLAQALRWRAWGCHTPWSTRQYIWKITGRVVC